MIYYEYDSEGFLLGWHEDDARPNSTTLSPVGITPGLAKWNGNAWIEDTSKEIAKMQLENEKNSKKTAATNLLKTYNPATATNQETKDTLAAIIEILQLG